MMRHFEAAYGWMKRRNGGSGRFVPKLSRRSALMRGNFGPARIVRVLLKDEDVAEQKNGADGGDDGDRNAIDERLWGFRWP